MKARIIGSGSVDLYFASLMKREDPAHDTMVHERGSRNTTWSFGVVFSIRKSSRYLLDQLRVYS